MRRIAALWVFVAATSIGAQEKKVVTLPYDGPDFFSHILFAKGLTPVTSFDEALAEPNKTVIFVWGDVRPPEVTRFFRLQEKIFRAGGGNLLVATDYPMETSDYVVSGRLVQVPADMAFGKHPLCPWVNYPEPDTEEGRSMRAHPLFHLLQNRIATNRPSTMLETETKQVQGLVTAPRPGRPFGLGMTRWFYLGASPQGTPHGRVVVIAGHGMFTNGMMLQPDTDNFAFAINAVEWLREGPDVAKRTQALFVVDGKIITEFYRDLTPPMPPIPMPRVEMINRLLRGLEDEGFFHWATQQVLGDRYRYAVSFLIGLATCIGLLYGAKKFMDGRMMNDTAAPRMVGVATITPPEDPRDRQRQKALYRQKESSDEARFLARQWLAAELGLTAEQFTPGEISVQVSGFFLTRRSLQRQVDLVIELACAKEPIKVSRSEFAALTHSLSRLSRAWRSGRLTLLLGEKKVT